MRMSRYGVILIDSLQDDLTFWSLSGHRVTIVENEAGSFEFEIHDNDKNMVVMSDDMFDSRGDAEMHLYQWFNNVEYRCDDQSVLA